MSQKQRISPIRPKRGQVWEDIPAGREKDLFISPRRFQVKKIDRSEGVAWCEVTEPAVVREPRDPRKKRKVSKAGREIAIRLDRFRPVVGGYRPVVD